MKVLQYRHPDGLHLAVVDGEGSVIDIAQGLRRRGVASTFTGALAAARAEPASLADLAAALAAESDAARLTLHAEDAVVASGDVRFTIATPVDAPEVWASGVTYVRSRAARMEESGAWPAERWPTVPTCSGWPAATGPRRWSPASPPSTAFRCWSSRPAPATTSPSTSAWTVRPVQVPGRSQRRRRAPRRPGLHRRPPFVNNASFGAYATVVQSPAYRDDKAHTTSEMLPGLLVGHQGPRPVARAGNVTVEGPQAVLVSNNVYGMGDIAGLGRRARLDRGTLGVFGVTVASAVQAAGLLRGSHSRGLTILAAPEVVVDSDAFQIPVGVDGEALMVDTPVRCTVQPLALRVRVPRDRPGVPDSKPEIDWKRLWQLALTVSGSGGAAADHRGPGTGSSVTLAASIHSSALGELDGIDQAVYRSGPRRLAGGPTRP